MPDCFLNDVMSTMFSVIERIKVHCWLFFDLKFRFIALNIVSSSSSLTGFDHAFSISFFWCVFVRFSFPAIKPVLANNRGK